MKRLLILSIIINLLLASALAYMTHKMGGWNYALYRLRNSEAGIYTHRKSLFERLPVRPGAVVMLGDSETSLCEWQELLGDSIRVLNRGISGDYMDGMWARLDEVLRHKPVKIFLMIGVNDLFFGNEPEAIEARYREIVQKIRHDSPNSELILQSILPVNGKVRSLPASNAEIQAMNVRIAQIAKDYALPYVDIYNELIDASGNLSPKFTDDGIHLNGLGYFVWKRQIAKMVSNN
ncbi:MAG TPA: GDSL-type esterase/lipase family protein [Saprospiraceae bacterium]|nr:GDSL-type esterase/lipase family protein [Saprospiraceae bacterium]